MALSRSHSRPLGDNSGKVCASLSPDEVNSDVFDPEGRQRVKIDSGLFPSSELMGKRFGLQFMLLDFSFEDLFYEI